MPLRVHKQSPPNGPVKPKREQDVISRIRDIEIQPGIKLLEYGRGKTGKTRLGCTFPKPALLIGATEDGTKSVSNVAGVRYVQIYSTAEFDNICEHLETGRYKTAILDHASGFQDIIGMEVTGQSALILSRAGISSNQWQIIVSEFKSRMRRFLTLAESHNLYCVVIAHERNFSNDDVPPDMLTPSVGADLSPKCAAWLNGACDYICETFIREEQEEQKIKIGKEVRTTKRATGKYEYCLRIGPHPVYMTGFRVPDGIELPDVIVNPNFEKINALIHGKSL
jgi:hypothetical protein